MKYRLHNKGKYVLVYKSKCNKLSSTPHYETDSLESLKTYLFWLTEYEGYICLNVAYPDLTEANIPFQEELEAYKTLTTERHQRKLDLVTFNRRLMEIKNLI